MGACRDGALEERDSLRSSNPNPAAFWSTFTYQKGLPRKENVILVPKLIKPLWFNVLEKLSHSTLDTYF